MIDVSEVGGRANAFGYTYDYYYARVAAHEFGHALGLKHPFKDEGIGPFDPSITAQDSIMAYGDDANFTNFDLAALIAVNGVEDDLNYQGQNPIFRFYNTRSGGHFFTSNPEEAEAVATTLFDTFNFEGTGFYADTAPRVGEVAAYRFYNNVAGGHFYTINETERDYVLSQLAHTYQYEGVGFYTAAHCTRQNILIPLISIA